MILAAAVLAVLLSTPVASFFATTVAFGTIAPLAS